MTERTLQPTDLETPRTSAEFAKWLGVSLRTVEGFPPGTPGRMRVGRLVRWHLQTFLRKKATS